MERLGLLWTYTGELEKLSLNRAISQTCLTDLDQRASSQERNLKGNPISIRKCLTADSSGKYGKYNMWKEFPSDKCMHMKGKVGTMSLTNGPDLDDALAISKFCLCRPLWVFCLGKTTDDPKLLPCETKWSVISCNSQSDKFWLKTQSDTLLAETHSDTLLRGT